MIFLLFILVLLSHISIHASRESSYPFISGDSFRQYCDHRFDEITRSINPSLVKKGDTIFLKADAPYIVNFFTNYYPHIKNNFIIVSHNGDYSIPGLRTGMDLPPANFNLLDYIDARDSKIIMWFGQNIDLIHPRLKPIPIGIANRCWGHGNVDHFKRAIEYDMKWEEKRDLVYLNFDVGTNRAIREPILRYFSQQSFCSNDRKRPHQEYLLEMKKYKFVLCPPGNGMDCHRIWEALLLGCIPIVQHSTLDELYQGIPVIIVSDWKVVTPEFLSSQLNEFKNKSMNMDKIYFDYWTYTIDLHKS